MQYKIYLLTTLILAAPMLCAQEGGSIGAYTPYSLYGLGDFVYAGTAAAVGMGGVQSATRSTRSIDMLNPAGAAARDSLTFVIDFGGDMRNIYAKSSATRTSFNTANFHHIAMAFPLWGARSGINLGFMPYTRVGYDIEQREQRTDIILHTGDVRYQYKGEDGLSQIFLNAGFNILPQWAVGAGARYYFGKINRYSNTIFRSSAYFFDTYRTQSLRASGFSYSLGTHYTQALSDNRKLILGLSIAPKININATETTIARNHPYSTSSAVYTDTAYSTTTSADLLMPTTISASAGFVYGDKWALGAEFTYADWSKTAISGRTEMGKSYDVRIGSAFTPNRYDVRYYWKRITYRAGLRYSQTPMVYDGKSIPDRAASIGLGLPLRGVGELNIGAEYGWRGSTSNGGVREDYLAVSISLTLFEMWFMQYKYD